jgi:nucleotide-binding universal stress UspA family protein
MQEAAVYTHIMVPVDLHHPESVEKSLVQACDLATHYDCPVTVVGVAAAAPSDLARTPAEYRAKLEAVARDHAERSGVTVTPRFIQDVDPAVDLDHVLVEACHDLKADLVVMGSHTPRFHDVIFGSHAGQFVRHSDVSVFVVR